METICVLGLGYIGLPTALVLASSGYRVAGVDTDKALIENLNQGRMKIEEADLQELLRQVKDRGAISFHTRPVRSSVFIIAVPTPLNTFKQADISYVLQALDSVIPCLSPQDLVVVESTIPAGCCEQVLKPRLEGAGFMVGRDVFLAHCPERVLPGRILQELINCPRIIGGCTVACGERARQIYQVFSRGRLYTTNCTTAEITKLVENTYRDVNIALVNELTLICQKLGINVLEVIGYANQHPRVSLLHPGPGVGGHCLAVDPYFIVEKAPQQARLIALAREINSTMPLFIIETAKKLVNHKEKAKIAVFGLAYKGNVGDVRESPAVQIKQALSEAGYIIGVFDPHVPDESITVDEAVRDADLILILTDHDEFKSLDYSQLALKMHRPVVFDTRNILPEGGSGTNGCRLYNLGNVAAT